MQSAKPEIVVAGHTCLDIIPTFGKRKAPLGVYERAPVFFAPGKMVTLGPVVFSTGGAVSNTGLALHRLGVRTRLMGKVGDDLFGHAILDILRRHEPALADGMIVIKGEDTSYTIVISPPDMDRFFLHCPGANDTFSADDVAYDQLISPRVFHFGYPTLMRRMWADHGKELEILLRRVKERNITTSLDMAQPDPESDAGRLPWEVLLEQVLPHTDLFLPSLDEILFMLEPKQFEELQQESSEGDAWSRIEGSSLSNLSQRLLKLGTAIVVLKLGDQGLYMRTTGDPQRFTAMGKCAPGNTAAWLARELLTPCFEAKVVGTTGAGDCTIAGFLTGLLHGSPPEEVMTGAVAVGACSVEQVDATSGIRSWATVQQRIQSGWKRRPVSFSLLGWRWNQQTSIWIGPHDAST